MQSTMTCSIFVRSYIVDEVKCDVAFVNLCCSPQQIGDIFLFFQNISFDISSKLTPKEMMCSGKSNALFWTQ